MLNGMLSDSLVQSHPFPANQGLLPKAYAINCSFFAIGAQNTIYKEGKMPTKRNHP